MTSQDSMKPVDVNAGRLIPKGNLDIFNAIRKELDAKEKGCFHSKSTLHPSFTPGFTTPNGFKESQTSTIK